MLIISCSKITLLTMKYNLMTRFYMIEITIFVLAFSGPNASGSSRFWFSCLDCDPIKPR